MRYLLDTNTLIFAISDREQLSNDILNNITGNSVESEDNPFNI